MTRRRSPLPPDWHRRIRPAVLERDGRCMWPDDGTPHGGPLEVDHIGDDDDHRLENLRALCKRHHATRTGRQAAAASAAARARRPRHRRPVEPHPGVVRPDDPPRPGSDDRLGVSASQSVRNFGPGPGPSGPMAMVVATRPCDWTPAQAAIIWGEAELQRRAELERRARR